MNNGPEQLTLNQSTNSFHEILDELEELAKINSQSAKELLVNVIGKSQTDVTSLIPHLINYNSLSLLKIVVELGADKEKLFNDISPLHFAIARKRIEIAHFLVTAGCRIDTLFNNYTSLHLAMKTNQLELVKLLINAGADITKVTDRELAFYFSIRLKDADRVKQFLNEGINLESIVQKYTPLHHAITYSTYEIVELLLQSGANVNAICNKLTPLQSIIHNYNFDDCISIELDNMFRLLIRYGADKESTFKNMTPLHYAIFKNIACLVTFLVQEGANVEAIYKNKTALHHAISTKNTCLVRKLLASNADTFALYNGMSPLHHAIIKNSIYIVELLLKHEIDKEYHYKDMTPLHHAINLLEFSMVQMLLESGVDLEATYRGMTPLVHALSRGSYQIAELLLGHEINTEGVPEIVIAIIANNMERLQQCLAEGISLSEKYQNKLPLHMAVECNRAKMVKALINAGASIEAKYNEKTPLHLAISYRNLDVVNVLLEAGANMEAHYKGKTALHYAILKQNEDITLALINNGASKQTPFEILKHTSSDILPILQSYCTVLGIPYRHLFNNIDHHEIIDLDAFIEADDAIDYLEEHAFSTEVVIYALRLLQRADAIKVFEDNLHFGEENAMEDSKVLRANYFFKETIQPHFKSALLNYSKNQDYEEAFTAIDKAIKSLIIDKLLAEATVQGDTNQINFIKCNKDKLIQSDENALKASVNQFVCTKSSTQAAWRGLNPFAPVTGSWPNLLTKPTENSDIFSTEVSHAGQLDRMTAHTILRERIAYYYLAVIDPLDGDDAIRATRVQNFIEQLAFIRNAHGADDPSCFPGCITRIADMGAFHSVAQLPITIKEWLRTYFTEKALSLFRASIESMSSDQEKQNLLTSLITLTTDNAQSIILKPENYDSSLLPLRKDFIAKLGSDEDNIDFISQNNLYPICENDYIYIEQNLNDIGAGNTGVALSEQLYKDIDKVPSLEDIAGANPFLPLDNKYEYNLCNILISIILKYSSAHAHSLRLLQNLSAYCKNGVSTLNDSNALKEFLSGLCLEEEIFATVYNEILASGQFIEKIQNPFDNDIIALEKQLHSPAIVPQFQLMVNRRLESAIKKRDLFNCHFSEIETLCVENSYTFTKIQIIKLAEALTNYLVSTDKFESNEFLEYLDESFKDEQKSMVDELVKYLKNNITNRTCKTHHQFTGKPIL